MKVKSEHVPSTKLIENALRKIEFSDTFSTTNHFNSIQEIANLIFNNTPRWVEILFAIRNFLVGLVGLKTKPPEDYSEAFKVGGYVGFFRIYNIEENEVLMGLDDSHLNFRASVYNSKDKQFNIKITTLVEYNNFKGKVYFFFVKPFHRIVVKRMVRQAYKLI